MDSKQVLDKNEIHLIPFYSKYYGPIEIEYCDLTEDTTVIRGVKVIKKNLSREIRVFDNQKEIKGSLFYWKVDSECFEDKFEKALKLMEEGLGFKSKSICSFFIKK